MSTSRPPWKTALLAWLITLAVGIVAGVIAMSLIDSGASPFARGERFGQGLALLSVWVAAVAYYLAWRKQRKRR